MKTAPAAAAVLLLLAAPLWAHRLDEYLEATIFSIEKDRVAASMRLIPGVAVFPAVFAGIDTNGDGVISEAEQRVYAERVLRDVSLRLDGQPLRPRLISVRFPKTEDMKEGLGEIQIEFTAELPRGGESRRLIFENHHQSRMAAYLVNTLIPHDRGIQIAGQHRNENQSFYELDYAQADAHRAGFSEWWSRQRARIGGLAFASMFRLGMRHIAEGTDHLLFLLALLLPAPLIVSGGGWGGFAGARASVVQILRVVTAFTIGHSITLVLAALGFVHVPSRPIEVLIAVSVLVSAAHAVHPLFPGRESVIAASFGLIHGLAFATTLGQLGLGRWERVAGILGFNLGIETMQLLVVAATMPSLMLLSRTRGYSLVRIGAALFAGFASAGWIAERLLNVQNSVDAIVDTVAHHALSIAAVLFLISVACWPAHAVANKQIKVTF